MDESLRKTVLQLDRPAPALMTVYLLTSLLMGPLFLLLLVPLYFRYKTLQYEFDDEGVTMRWGVLFRREISLTYARIQDIHLSSNIVERWLGLAKIEVQTASGSSSAEMVLEGLREFEQVRDFLYSKMRGIRQPSASTDPAVATAPSTGADPLASTLARVADELQEIRTLLQERLR